MQIIFFALLVFPGLSTASHTLQYVTAITPAVNSTVGELDGEQFVCYCNSNIISKATWIKNIHHDYWRMETARMWRETENLQFHLNQIVEYFNHTKGNHTLHQVYRCDLDDDCTQKGFVQFYYDGEAFISLRLETGNWTAANDKAESFLNNWERTENEAEHWKHYLNKNCVHWLRLVQERKAAEHTLQNITAITPAINSTSAELNGEQSLLLCTKATKIPEWKNKTDAGKESDGRPAWQVIMLLLLVDVTASKVTIPAAAAVIVVIGLVGINRCMKNRDKRKKENEDIPLKVFED
ncbi:hypothetical protein QTP86_014758 [Hemibagrus guttatus]|nr:hypothetical protein QTP86_014758 [Hemibagrus guttatus]